MKAFDTNTLGGRIATARRAHKPFKATLQDWSALPSQALLCLRAGRPGSSHNAVELAQALKVPADWLINGEGPSPFADTSGSIEQDESGESIALTTQKSLAKLC